MIHRWTAPHWRMLCYHDIPDSVVATFKQQMFTLSEEGYRFVSFEEGWSACSEGTLDGPFLTVTFDDGDETIYRNALPILQQIGIPGFIYATPDYIRQGTVYRASPPLPAITWNQLRAWRSAGHGVGSHTLTHAPLTSCDVKDLERECAESKAILEDELQCSILHLSYPWGLYSSRVCRFLHHSHFYYTAATLERGIMHSGHPHFRLRRSVCHPGTDPKALIVRLKKMDKWSSLHTLYRRIADGIVH